MGIGTDAAKIAARSIAQFGWHNYLPSRAVELLLAAEETGVIRKTLAEDGKEYIAAGSRRFGETTPRELAQFRDGLKSLEQRKLIEDNGDKSYRITTAGYDRASRIRESLFTDHAFLVIVTAIVAVIGGAGAAVGLLASGVIPIPPPPGTDPPTITTSSVPIGTIVAYFGNNTEPPTGWLYCDGGEIPGDARYQPLREFLGKLSYLDASIKEAKGFHTPNLTGAFLRGLNIPALTGAGRDPDVNRLLGSFQDDGLQSHVHPVDKIEANAGQESPVGAGIQHFIRTGQTTTSAPVNTKSGEETRPKNVAVNFLIKAFDPPAEVY